MFSILLLTAFLFSSRAFALSIVDCNGSIRAMKEVEPGIKSDVSIDVMDASGVEVDGVDVTLSNTKTNEVVKATVHGGEAEFQGISDGTWLLGSPHTGLLFSTIWLSEPVIGTAPAIGGAAPAVVGAIGVGLLINEATSGGSSSPSVVPSPIPTVIPPTSPPSTCPGCNPDEDAPEIDDFFDEEQNGAANSNRNKNPHGSATSEDCFISDDVEPLSPFR